MLVDLQLQLRPGQLPLQEKGHYEVDVTLMAVSMGHSALQYSAKLTCSTFMEQYRLISSVSADMQHT